MFTLDLSVYRIQMLILRLTLDNVLISGEAELEYTITIPAQDAANTYESFLMYVVDQDSPVIIKDIVVTDDSGSTGGDAVLVHWFY